MGDYSTFQDLLTDGRIIFPKNGNGSPRKKYFKSERQEEGQCATNWWNNVEFGCNQDATDELKALFGVCPFDNPKPVSLIKAIIQLGSIKDNAIILDFFAGSGTTGQATLELNNDDGGNRKFILCQNNEPTDSTPNGVAYDCTSKRLKRVMTGSCYDGNSEFDWIKNNTSYGCSLDVYEIDNVANFEHQTGKTPFDVIDETLYGREKFSSIKEKIEWVCENFEGTQKVIESDSEYKKRLGEN